MGLEMRPNVRKVDETVDPAQHVIVRDVPLEAEAIETGPLASPAVRPSSTKSPVATTRESAPNSTIKRSFSTQFVDSSRLLCAKSGHCPRVRRMGQTDPLLSFKIGPMNGR
jgi:hypothetical protein